MDPVLDLPEVLDRHAFNRARWEEVCTDPTLARVEGRIETDAHGHVLMSPPPGFDHSERQAAILGRLSRSEGSEGGTALPECPVSTDHGVRGVDVVWISDQRRREALRDNLLVIAPEVCIEVLSPGNTGAEMTEKRRLLFVAGAEEVWFCDTRGQLFFFHRGRPDVPTTRSSIFPDFPARLDTDAR